MSSIAEGYKVIQREGEVEAPVDPRAELVTAAVEELVMSLGERCKRHELHENSLVIQTGKEDTPGIVVKVEGYAEQTGVVSAATQEDSTKIPEGMPPVDNTTDYPTKGTDQVASVRKYNTDQYMKHSALNPKKFG